MGCIPSSSTSTVHPINLSNDSSTLPEQGKHCPNSTLLSDPCGHFSPNVTPVDSNNSQSITILVQGEYDHSDVHM